MGGTPWTPDEDRRLWELKGDGLSCADMARCIGRSEAACKQRLMRLFRAGGGAPPLAPPPWTDADLGWLALHYIRLGGRACAEYLGRSLSAVQEKAKRLGVARCCAKEKPLQVGMRHCHDCGKPTTDYRCPKCLSAWRRRHGISENIRGEEGL